MHRTSSDTAPSVPAGSEHFSGPVAMKQLASLDAPRGTALLVTFEAGSRTYWHSHPNGQVLFVTDGDGKSVPPAGLKGTAILMADGKAQRVSLQAGGAASLTGPRA